MAGSVAFGTDLFTENQALKAELAKQQKQLQPLHQKVQELEVKVKALTITNDLLSGKIKVPPQEAPATEAVIWNYKLSSREEYMGHNGYPTFARNVPDGQGQVLQITGEAGKSNCLVKFFSPHEFARLKGKKVTCTVMVKGENITGKGEAKFMLMVGLPNKKTDWPAASIGAGRFDWRPVRFTYRVPIDAENMAMVIGLQGPAGTIYYKNMKVVVSKE